MTFSKDDLILFYYGETENQQAIAEWLESDPEAKKQYEDLTKELDTLQQWQVPARDADYGEKVWLKVAGKLSSLPEAKETPHVEPIVAILHRLMPKAKWIPATLAAAAALSLFWLGRISVKPDAELFAADPKLAKIVLLSTINRHLDDIQMLLTELENEKDGPPNQLELRKQRAAALTSQNRFYRLTAGLKAEDNLASLLQEVEFLLLEIANGDQALPTNFAGADPFLAFKIRLMRQEIRNRIQKKQSS